MKIDISGNNLVKTINTKLFSVFWSNWAKCQRRWTRDERPFYFEGQRSKVQLAIDLLSGNNFVKTIEINLLSVFWSSMAKCCGTRQEKPFWFRRYMYELKVKLSEENLLISLRSKVKITGDISVHYIVNTIKINHWLNLAQMFPIISGWTLLTLRSCTCIKSQCHNRQILK